jgi:hypothetical protein
MTRVLVIGGGTVGAQKRSRAVISDTEIIVVEEGTMSPRKPTAIQAGDRGQPPKGSALLTPVGWVSNSSLQNCKSRIYAVDSGHLSLGNKCSSHSGF